jgi:hypothetical protein
MQHQQQQKNQQLRHIHLFLLQHAHCLCRCEQSDRPYWLLVQAHQTLLFGWFGLCHRLQCQPCQLMRVQRPTPQRQRR